MKLAWVWVVVMLGCGGDDGGGNALQVTTDTGIVEGVAQDNVNAFLGVPYAAPPIGELRWRPPQPAASWTGVRQAYEVASACPQGFSLTGDAGAEDCLYLNVWIPARATKAVPVMVWLHGGAFIFGSGGETYYSGQHLADSYGVAVVTINYRLGAFGFLAHPALTAEDPAYPSSGNYGIEDQLAALQWVHRNIAAFGGDPAQVTLFGESAGGYSACLHYLSPRSAGLFSAVIAESGLCATTANELTLHEAEALGVTLAGKLGCTGAGADALACMRGKGTTVLQMATALPPAASQLPGGPFYLEDKLLQTFPVVDGFVVKAPMRTMWAAGEFAKLPLILGANRDEGTLFHSTLFGKEIADETEYRAALTRRFGAANVDAIIARYPVSAFPSANRALAEVSGDAFVLCAARRTARLATAAGVPTYLYSFETLPESPFLQGLGVFHTAELPFVFGIDKFPLGRIGASTAMADAIGGYWTQLAIAHDPNAAGAPPWPIYDAVSDRLLVFDGTVHARSGSKTAACDFWDAFQP